ncbi:polysaccharide biosynthesis tyrosine autokinase [Aquabacterium sp. G14]|uniref:polysaccharide biosynthesis tyrosine autokinase n=1 Tax=Aquabacterium sp. G14 TaxID=3130164 RepID=UPI0030B1B782
MTASPTPLPAAQPPHRDDDEGISLVALLNTALDQRWLIGGATVIGLLLAGAYTKLSTPIYQADTVIQVESGQGGGMGAVLGDSGGDFSMKSSTSAEIEILRSRLVVGRTVEQLKLDVQALPKYLPVLGEWLARGATAPSQPGLLGARGYVHGNEALTIDKLELPALFRGHDLTVRLQDSGYSLLTAQGQTLVEGHVGMPAPFAFQGQKGEILISAATGLPGAEFTVRRTSKLASTRSLQSRLDITEKGRGSGLIQITLEDSDPERAARILNRLSTLYVQQNNDRKSAEAERTLAFLEKQLPLVRKDVDAAENRFNQFRMKQGTFDLGAEAGAMLSEISGLRIKLLTLQQQRKELSARYTNEHPVMLALDTQISDLNSQVTSMEGTVKTLPALEQDLLNLTRDVKVSNQLYNTLLNSYQQMRLVKEGKVGNVRIIDVASVPEWPIRPHQGKVLTIGLLGGMVAGFALAFLRHSIRAGITDPSELEQHLGLHVFATVPHSAIQAKLAQTVKAEQPGTHLLSLTHPDEPAVESLRSLRTALQFAMLDAPNRIVLITGATPGIGKSFTSANFAAVLAASDKRVLLVDADMRKGHIHQFFGIERGMGLSELIAGTQTLDKVVHKNLAPGLDFVTTGSVPPNPAELLMSPHTSQLLKDIASAYDIVLIDTPPVLAVADTAVLAPQVGTVFLVAREDVSTLGEVEETTKRLKQVGVTVQGVIFNGINVDKRRYGNKYSRYRYRAYNYTSDKQ